MNNYLQPGNVVTLTAPAGGVTSGTGYKIGQLFVVATNDADATDPFEGMTTGVFTLPKTTGTAWTEGALLYWDDSTDKATTVAAGNLLIGCASVAALSADATGVVRLNATARADGISDAELEDDAVDTAAIQDDAVTTAKIADDAVTAAKLADDAVVTANIVDLNVTRGKLEAALVSAASGIAIYDHADDVGVNILIAAQAGIDRTVMVVAKVTETLAGTSTTPVFDVGYATDPDNIIDGLTSGTDGDVFLGVGTLPAGESLDVTVADGTGGSEAGKLQVAAIVVPT
jgi:predicted RecA/RadA family phage recombinase